MNPTILPPAIGKIVEQTGFLALVYIVMLLGWDIGIITWILTYNERGLFYKAYKEVLTGLLLASLTRVFI